MEPFPADLLESWATTMPLAGENLAYPPANHYVPTRVPVALKAPREESNPIGKPTKVQVDGSQSELWFKQDDQFD